MSQEHDSSRSAFNDRLAFIDNAKFLMMVFVVFFHVQCASQPLGRTPVVFLLFHMRIFCFISGMVSKDALNLSGLIKLVTRLIVPYVFYSVVIDPLAYMVQFATPHFQYDSYVLANLTLHNDQIGWYLLALAAWRLSGSLLHLFVPYGAIRFGTAVFFSYVGNHYVQAHQLSAGWLRMTSLFPVFVAGQMFPVRWLSKLPSVGGASIILGGLVLAVCFYVKSSQVVMNFESQIPAYGEIVISEKNYSSEGNCSKWALLLWTTSLFRNMYELSKGLVILLCFCPRSSCSISEWGKNSIYPFLLHRVVFFYRWQYMQAPAALSEQLLLGLGLLMYCTLCTAILASRPVRMILCVFLEPLWLESLLGLHKESPGESEVPSELPSEKSSHGVLSLAK
jgi:fucose 4-O-acetylase-like acetyltransferase